MISIKNYTSDFVYLTLKETTTLTGSPINYVLRLHSNLLHDESYFLLSGDTSPNVDRYNKFPINLTTLSARTENFDYFVYQFSGNTYQISGLTDSNIIESGLCSLISTATTQTYTYPINSQQEYYFQ